MKLVVISDTHGWHDDIKNMPDGDVLIHCGDFTNIGEHEQVEDFIQWMAGQPHRFKIFIAGNHDRSFDTNFPRSNRDNQWLKDVHKRIQDLGLYYLENSSVDILGVKFWGSPITPDFYPEMWAFNCPRTDINKVWKTIPLDANVVITHGPPQFKLDWTKSGKYVGCGELMYTIQEVKPRFHFFGHIHESYGVVKTRDTIFANASLLDHRYDMKHYPLEFDYYAEFDAENGYYD